MKNKISYFEGLNALRFLAAFFVVLMHIRASQISMDMEYILPAWPIFLKGKIAVNFFFVLSGFLITYILLKEQDLRNTISIKKFYLKRVFRIWPLYFIIVVFGLFFFWYLAPKLGFNFEVTYNKFLAVFLYIFFGANLMSSLYKVGGILNVLWSIAVEEQFYLFWAPLFKYLKNHLLIMFISVFLISYSVNVLNGMNYFELSPGYQSFIGKLLFHYMAIGAIFAYFVFYHEKRFVSMWCFSKTFFQIILFILVLGYMVLFQRTQSLNNIETIFSGVMFGWLIVNVSVNPKRLINLESPILNYLGKISYGIYMYHSIAIYIVSFIFIKYLGNYQNFHLLSISLVLGLTILFASTSYFLLERKILEKGKLIITKQELKKENVT